MGLCEPAVRKKLDFFAPGGESASKLIASARFQTPRGTPKKLPFFMGTFLGTFWALPGRSWGHRDIFGVPRGVRERAGTINFDAPDRPWESLGRFGRPESISGAILGRFWTPIFTPICPPSRRFCRRVRAERHTDRHTLQSKKLFGETHG